MAVPGNQDFGQRVSFPEPNNAITDEEETVLLCNNVNDDETQLISGETLSIELSDYRMVQIGSNSKLLECRCKDCYSSSDEENDSDVTKTHEIGEDSQGKTSKMIDLSLLSMPMKEKRGCLNSRRYILLIAELKDLQDRGDFDGHERMIRKQLAIRSADPDMHASLQIERAIALYMQNDVKSAKKITKFVLKLEKLLENPGILTGRALNLLTSIYKTQKKFGNAMECVERAATALEYHDSPVDKAELHQSYGGLINSVTTVRCTLKKKAYNSYKIAFDYATDPVDKEYIQVKMAALLLGEPYYSAKSKFPRKADVVQAKKHLDYIENGPAADKMAVGTKIKLHLLRSDQYLYEGNVAMAMAKAKEAIQQIESCDGFGRQLASAEKRILSLSEIGSQQHGISQNNEVCLSNGYLADGERSGGEGDSSDHNER